MSIPQLTKGSNSADEFAPLKEETFRNDPEDRAKSKR
jgi:hypothetical protein